MQIQNINSTDFNGGYKFIRMPKAAKEELPNIIKKGKTIYDSFDGKKTNVFLVARDYYHQKIAQFIEKYNLNYRYYPDIKSEMDFKLGHPEKLIEILKTQTPKEIDFNEIAFEAERHELQRKKCQSKKEKKAEIKRKNQEAFDNIIKQLRIEMDENTLKTKYGAKIFENTSKTKRYLISAPNSEGFHYVKIMPIVSSSGDNRTRLLEIRPDGKIDEYTSDINRWGTFNQKLKETYVK